MYVISRCLMGVNCKYNGGNNRNKDVIDFCRDHKCITVCPETAGGLKSPRDPAEQQVTQDGGCCIIDKAGRDLTEEFELGTRKSIREVTDALEENGERLEGAILKAKSPSCGHNMIYDGTFTGTIRPGDGIFTRELRKLGVKICGEDDFMTEAGFGPDDK